MQVVHIVTTALLTVLPHLRLGYLDMASHLYVSGSIPGSQEKFVVEKVAMKQAILGVLSLSPC
jgi:hypothetical protein